MNISGCGFKPPEHSPLLAIHTLNLLFSSSAKELGLHYDSLLWELLLLQNFVVALEGQRKGFITHCGRYQLPDGYKERQLPTHSI